MTQPTLVWLSPLLLLVLFGLDILTPQKLVLAILFNVPIALSSLTLSSKLTIGLTLTALLANLVAGLLNAWQEQSYDPIALGNRILAALSFLLVALLSLQSARTWAQEAEKRLEERKAQQERQLRQLLQELSQSQNPQALLEQSCRLVRSLMRASGVMVRQVSAGRWAEEGYQTPNTWQPPREVPPSSKNSVRWSVLEGRMFLVAQWQPNLLLLVESPQIGGALGVMDELLRSLEGLLQRAELLSHLQQHEREMVRRNGVIRDLIYAFSHDLRTPLIANTMNMQQALAGAYGPLAPHFADNLRNGLAANQELLELAEKLLLVAQLESGEALSPKTQLDLAELLRQTAERFAPLLQEKALGLQLDLPQQLWLEGRENDLRRVIQNLLENAIRFAPQGSDVLLTLHSKDSRAWLEVADQGPGVPHEMRPRLFLRFSKGTAGAGSGLGLYLARQIVQAHGGQIGYRDRTGGGSVFWLSLPLGVLPYEAR